MNHAMRHLGIPSVSVPMGLMSDTRMPVNLTFIGAAYSDATLLSYAYAYEQATHHRRPPPRVAPLDDEVIEYDPGMTVPPARRSESVPPEVSIDPKLTVSGSGPNAAIRISGTVRDAGGIASLRVYVNGHKVSPQLAESWNVTIPLSQLDQWRDAGATEVAVLVLAKDRLGNSAAMLRGMGAPARLSAR
jgi:amidase